MKITVPAILALAALVASASGNACDGDHPFPLCDDSACQLAEAICKAGCIFQPFSACDTGCTVLYCDCIKSPITCPKSTLRGGKVDAPQSHKKDVKSQDHVL